MSAKRLKTRIALEAARLLLSGEETDISAARTRAIQSLSETVHPRQAPTMDDIRRQMELLRRDGEVGTDPANRRERLLTALKLMWALSAFDPRLDPAGLDDDETPPLSDTFGPGACGEANDPTCAYPAPITIRLWTNNPSVVFSRLDQLGLPHITEPSAGGGEVRIQFHVRSARGHAMTFVLKLSPVPAGMDLQDAQRSGMDIRAVEATVREDYPDADLAALNEEHESWADPILVFRLLLQRLDGVKQKPEHHPEGDALYHSLQAFDLARQQFPYDEEFLLAALLHDVGKGIDPAHHIEAGLEALRGLISSRTVFLIEHHSAARRLKDGTLNGRLRTRIQESPWYEDLMALHAIDDAARRPGVRVPSVDEALAYLASMRTW